MKRLQYDVNGFVDEADEKTAAVSVGSVVIQGRYVLSTSSLKTSITAFFWKAKVFGVASNKLSLFKGDER